MTKFNDAFKSIPNLKVESVATALAWCWLVDFGQGNFADAKSAAELVLLHDWNGDTLMARAIVHELQGEYNQALSLFTEAFDLTFTVDQKLFIATLAHLTEQKAQETLADDFAVSLNLSSSSIWLKRIQALTSHAPKASIKLQTSFLEQIGRILPYFRTVLVRQDNFVQKERYSQKIQDKLTSQLEVYQNAEVYAIAEFLYSTLAQILSLAGQIKPAWELISHLTQAYSDSRKFLESGWFALNQGDLVITMGSWGNPILFGYCVAEVITNPYHSQILDRSTIDTGTAQKLYFQAREYFAQVQALRGEGMAIMRLAYLNAVDDQWNLAAFGYQEAREFFAQTGDILNVIAAEMGHLWTILQYQTLDSDCIKNLNQWTNWIQEQGAISWGMSWSFAFALAAEEVLLVHQEIEPALRFIEVAEIIAIKLRRIPNADISLSCQKLAQSCFLLLENVARKILDQLVLTDNLPQVFILTEKIRIYEINPFIISAIPTISQISHQLESGVLMLVYFVTNQAILMWGITKQGLAKTHISEQIPNQSFENESLNQIIQQWLNEIVEKDVNKLAEILLKDLLIQPFNQEINEAKHILIMPCSGLQAIPFSAFRFNQNLGSKVQESKHYLGLLKPISYINQVQELKNQNTNAVKNNKLLIITEDGNIIDNHLTNQILSESPDLSLRKALLLGIIQLYDYSNTEKDIKKIVKTVHLFLSSKTLFIAQSMFQDLAADLAIINIEDISLNQLASIELDILTNNILSHGSKVVVIMCQGKLPITTAMLTLLFHRELADGLSVAQSLYQAQQKISTLKAQEAIDICQTLQNFISWQSNSDRAIRGLITKHMGDILLLAGDYIRARQAYEAAINIFYSTGYILEARTLEQNYKLFNSFRNMTQRADLNRPIFQAPVNWNQGFIFGDFTLKNVEVGK
ncbi:MAG: CHAT domain-containing protein [Xenococcaceae cyanobacterium MO_188.B19]|nr:CHAT domain-containing protein [Xenococcaceae cyanobacterium MO_188.B19]